MGIRARRPGASSVMTGSSNRRAARHDNNNNDDDGMSGFFEKRGWCKLGTVLGH